MTSPPFVHLRLHSEFSITDGIVRIDEAVWRARQWGMMALGVGDLMNVFGMLKFYQACQKNALKPIIGCDIWLENEEAPLEPYRLLLLLKNRAGLTRLSTLLTAAYTQNQINSCAQIKPSWLLNGDNTGLLCLSGARDGDIGRALLKGQRDVARQRAQVWAQSFAGGFYLEVQRLDHAHSEALLQHTVALASQMQLPIVATHPIQFMHADDFKAHEARVCIAAGVTLKDSRRARLFTSDQYFLSAEDMMQRFADLPEALANTVEIAKRCTLSITLGHTSLPDFPTPAGLSLDTYLVQCAQTGLIQRLEQLYPEETIRATQEERYQQRLTSELETIVAMGFAGYFLIVADFINWAKHHACPVGPGRGSGAGSLVAFSLGITDLDPLAYALLFERFLNPERVSMPDFDVDFCQDNRQRVIDYVRSRYGAEAVSQIATFGTLASKAVIRDVGRVLDLPYSFCDQLSKLIPAAPGKQYSLDEALKMEPVLQERFDAEEEVRTLWQLAKKLEGLVRNVGMHAGGVLIAPGKLSDFCPLYQASGPDAVAVSMFDKDDVEAIGLVKFDFLGLKNLTAIDLSLQLIKTLDPSFSIDLNRLPLDDRAAYRVLHTAQTTAVFQLESEGMKRLLEKLKPDRFEDIIAVLALYRPGPLGSGMVDDFILRKAGKQAVNYFHPDLTACLEPTYGVIVYQEQVMQISQIVGGYTLGSADMLRRAMGKKKPEEMAAHRNIFITGAQKKGFDTALAEHLFDLMAKFAEYGFNKSHSAAYAVIAYQTAWLKAHHCAAFMAATMSLELHHTDQLKVFYDEACAHSIRFLPPDINESHYQFIPVDRSCIRYALGAIKGTGEAAINHIVALRRGGGPFRDLYDFCCRVDKKWLNKRALEALIRAGAFDSLDANRAKLLAHLEACIALSQQQAAEAHQGGLFDEEPLTFQFNETAPWDHATLLAQEKLALGFYFSGHPFSAYVDKVKPFISTPLLALQPNKNSQRLAGFVTQVRTKVGTRGKIAFLQLEDGHTRLDVSVFSEPFERYRAHIRADHVVVIEGKVSHDEFSGSLRVVAEHVYTLAEARSRYAHHLAITLNSKNADAQRLAQLLTPYRSETAGCPVKVSYRNHNAQGDIALPPSWGVRLDEELIQNLQRWLGEEAVQIKWA